MMAKRIFELLLIAGVALAFSLEASGETPEGRASIDIGGNEVIVENLYVQEGLGGGVTVLISDIELPARCTPFDTIAVAEKKDLTGVLLSIGDDLAMASGMYGLFHPSLEAYDGYLSLDGELNAERAGEMIEGTFEGIAAIDVREIPVSASFSVPAQPDPGPIRPRKIEGADSEPARAFAEMVDAVVTEDFDGFLKGVSAEMREMIVGDGAGPEVLRDVADFLLPENMTITGTEINGDRAIVTADAETEICQGVEIAKVTVDMVREEGVWKVVKVSSVS